MSVIDRQPERLTLVEALDATPINDSKDDAAVDQIRELTLDQAAEGYQRFDDREDGRTKVLLHP